MFYVKFVYLAYPVIIVVFDIFARLTGKTVFSNFMLCFVGKNV